MSFVGILTLIFIVLKVMGLVTMTWFWVFSPIWISLLALVVFGVIVFIAMMTGSRN